MLAGDAQARGVYLDGYGVLFDVGVPILRQSMMWSLRTIYEQDDENLKAVAVAVDGICWPRRANVGQRREIETSIARLELAAWAD